MRNRLLVALFGLAASATAFAVDAPALSADQQKVLQLTTRLEAEPLSDTDKSMRSWLMKFLTESPDVNVTICDTLGILGEKKYTYSGELVMQTMFGMAAWEIGHPGSKPLDVDVQAAGVRSALKAYASILAQHPEGKIAQMEALAAHEAAGDLDKHMEGVVAEKCKKD